MAESGALLVRRIPPWQAALLFLIAAGCAALNIYGTPSTPVRLLTIAGGFLAAGAGVAATRMYLVVDEDGIGVRRLLREKSIDWDDVSDVTVARGSYNRVTLRVVRSDNTFIDVPTALVLPGKPTSTPRTLAQVGELARQIMACGQPYRRV